MEYQDILQDLKDIEKETIELKSSFSDWDAIGRTIAAFSTKKGGKIYVGVDNNGCPIGTVCNKKIKEKLINLARIINPPAIISPNLVNHDIKKELYICCINVEKGKGVYSYKNVPYERRGDVNHPLTVDEVFEIQKTTKKIYFDGLPAISDERPALITDIDEGKIKYYLETVKGIKLGHIDVKKFLQNNTLLCDGSIQVKNAAIMIFGKNIKDFIPHSKISIAEFPSTKVTENFVKTEVQEDDLTSLLNRAVFEIRKRTPVYSIVEGLRRIDVPEYPLEAIREALVNSIVHRDYFKTNTEIFIKIFKDRFEILNTGGFPFEGHSWEEVEKSGLSLRRNPILANFFENFKLMEQEGRGLSRMKDVTKKHGLPEPKIEVGETTFKITFYNVSHNPDILLNSPYRTIRDARDLNERQKHFLEILQKEKRDIISKSQYMDLLQVHEKTASRDLSDLVKRGILQRFGEKRGTRYSLIWKT